MALDDVSRIVVAEHGFSCCIAPYQGFEGQLDAGSLCAFHQQRATCGVAKDQEFGGAERFADARGASSVINSGDNGEAFFFDAGF